VTLATHSGELIHVVNTHYDDAGKRARAESSLIIREQARKWVGRFEDDDDPTHRARAPVILLGDFSTSSLRVLLPSGVDIPLFSSQYDAVYSVRSAMQSIRRFHGSHLCFSVLRLIADSPSEEDGYKNITSPEPVPSGSPSFTFLDSFTQLQARSTSSAGSASCAKQSTPYGPIKTYTGFTRAGKTATTRIDFIMLASDLEPTIAPPLAPSNAPGPIGAQHTEIRSVRPADTSRGDTARGGWEVVKYACIDNWVEEGDVDGWTGRWSDHRAVRVTIERN